MDRLEMLVEAMFQPEMRHISISTFIRTYLTVVFVVLPLTAGSSSSPSSDDVALIVKTLGQGTSEIEQIETLAKSPAQSIPLLVQELHVVAVVRLANGQHSFDVDHVLWCIRALRFMTGGRDFCAHTSHVFGTTESEQNRKYWLRFRYRSSCLTFFAVWPSRGSTYIAPADVQSKIIQQWRDWYREEGGKASYVPLQNPKPEDWLW